MRIYFDLVLFLFMNSVCGFTTNQIMERLNYIEDRINTESKFRRDDFSVLFHEIGSVKSVLQQSRENKIEEKDNANVQTAGKTDSEVVEKVQMLTTGFKEEKLINTRFRREIPELQIHVQNLKAQTDQIAANLKDILNGIEFLKDQNRKREETFNLFVNEIPEIKQNILDLRAQFEQTEVDESESFDEIKNDTEKITESIQQLKHSHELCLEKIDMKINLTKSLEEKQCEEVLGNSGTDSLTTEYNESNITVSSLSVPSIPSTTPDILVAKYSSCLELYQNGFKSNAVYGIEIEQERDISVYCDMTTDGGGWTVFQRRKDGSVDFYRDWDDYKTGFGDLTGEFWLGNEYLNAMTENDNPHELRIDLQDHEGNRAFAKYSNFKISSGEQNYKLEVSGYTGNAGDSLSHSDTGNGPHNEMEFRTKDRDRDGCATAYQGAWWFHNCFNSHLNGPYSYKSKCEEDFRCILWYAWKGYRYSLKFTEMKFR